MSTALSNFLNTARRWTTSQFLEKLKNKKDDIFLRETTPIHPELGGLMWRRGQAYNLTSCSEAMTFSKVWLKTTNLSSKVVILEDEGDCKRRIEKAYKLFWFPMYQHHLRRLHLLLPHQLSASKRQHHRLLGYQHQKLNGGATWSHNVPKEYCTFDQETPILAIGQERCFPVFFGQGSHQIPHAYVCIYKGVEELSQVVVSRTYSFNAYGEAQPTTNE
ncbi:hypothetical protein OSB04_029324, partial [Centaurea solstitialis]